MPPSFLIIQTAFIGDVVLATALVEKLHQRFPDSHIDFLLRKGNEDLLKGHPWIRTVLIWDKKKAKIRNLLRMIGQVRKRKYDYVINAHRFASSGLITVLSGAGVTIGFDKNPWSFAFTSKVKHVIDQGVHEVTRNQALIAAITDEHPSNPKLYPSSDDYNWTARYRGQRGPYICVAPASVWFTKQFPANQWADLVNRLDSTTSIFLLGASSDKAVCESITRVTTHPKVSNLAGELSYLESAALMQFAVMNYVNDSAPVHFASAVNAPVTAVFCSTVPAFGFGPLSEKSVVIETRETLSCKPCGLHGYNACPLGHFKCAKTISTDQFF